MKKMTIIFGIMPYFRGDAQEQECNKRNLAQSSHMDFLIQSTPHKPL